MNVLLSVAESVIQCDRVLRKCHEVIIHHWIVECFSSHLHLLSFNYMYKVECVIKAVGCM